MKYIWLRDGKPWKDTFDIEGKEIDKEHINAQYYKKVFYRDGLVYGIVIYNADTNGYESYNDEPSYVKYHNGKIESKGWHKDGVYHREGDKPALIEYYLHSGRIRTKQWSKNGVTYREGDKPAYISYSVDGDRAFLQWNAASGDIIKSEVVSDVKPEYD